MAISNGPVAVRLLAPAAPIRHGRRVTVRFSVRKMGASSHPSWTAGWDWGDGSVDVAELPAARLVRASRAHRYEAPGVYQVLVRIGLGPGEPASRLRYATVSRTRDEIAGCGWITAPTREPAPFGFLLGVPTASEPAGHLLMRYRTESFDVAAVELGWVIAEPNGVLHFGGSARVSGRRGDHPFRADAAMPRAAPRRPQRLALSLYSPGDVAGRDSPLHRVSGVVWPGRIDLAE